MELLSVLETQQYKVRVLLSRSLAFVGPMRGWLRLDVRVHHIGAQAIAHSRLALLC